MVTENWYLITGTVPSVVRYRYRYRAQNIYSVTWGGRFVEYIWKCAGTRLCTKFRYGWSCPRSSPFEACTSACSVLRPRRKRLLYAETPSLNTTNRCAQRAHFALTPQTLYWSPQAVETENSFIETETASLKCGHSARQQFQQRLRFWRAEKPWRTF